jgi:hypothetical protein
MTVLTSALWQIFMKMANNDQNQSKNGHLWLINFQDFFFQNWKSRDSEKNLLYVVDFNPIEVHLIYTFWRSLSFTSSILERLLWLSQHFEILLEYFLSCHFQLHILIFDVLLKMRDIFCPNLFWGTANWHLNW